MLVNMINWIWILGTCFILGLGATRILYGKEHIGGSLDMLLMRGLCAATVYAQMFSCFGKVGGWANVLLGILALALMIMLRKPLAGYMAGCVGSRRFCRYFIIAVSVGGILLWVSSGSTSLYDTYLYHAQAIRWIEEYGVVKGLGNLHNRFAYNSAFFCLQALFSWRFTLNRSLHSLNCLVAAIFIVYSISTLSVWKKETLKISDFLKLAFMIYFMGDEVLRALSAPGSDVMTQGLVLYIAAKWAELREKKEQEIMKYGELCIFVVWAVTIKLSSGGMILLAVYPAVMLLKEKRFRDIFKLLAAGIAVLLPFLARNVIISGYLLYPYSAIDLFQVDWKMPASLVDFDKREIMAWGRGMKSIELYNAGFKQWFPVWYLTLNIWYKILFVINILCIIALIVRLFSQWKKRKIDWIICVLAATSAIQLLLWFFSAPLTRYGGAYLLLLPAICLWLCGVFRPETRAASCITAYGVIGICLFFLIRFDCKWVDMSLIKPQDYYYMPYKEVAWEGLTIYVPTEGDRIGYHCFPSTPSEYRLDSIELRGNDLSEGFRVRDEYRDVEFNTYGPVSGE